MKRKNWRSKKKLGDGPSKANYQAAATKIQEQGAQKVRNAMLYGRVANTTEDTIDINCPINPFLLAEFLFGILYHPLAASDDYRDVNMAYAIVYSLMQNWTSLGRTYSAYELPRPIWTLWKLLQQKQCGRYRFTPDMVIIKSWVANNTAANAFNATHWNASLGVVSSYASGYGVATNNPTTNVTVDEVSIAKYFAKYNSFFDIVDIDSVKVSDDDASAFAFDAAGARDLNNVTMSGYSICAFAGYKKLDDTTSVTPVYISQTGTSALEVRIRNKFYAALRLCTPITGTTGTATDGSQPSFLYSQRSTKFIVSVNTLPSVSGWNTSPNTHLKGIVQLKPIPSVTSVQAIIDKFESLVKAAGGTLLTNWQSGWSSNDVKYLCAAIFRYYTRYYSGAYVGTLLMTADTDVAALPFPSSYPEHHGGLGILGFIRIPEFIARALGSMSPSSSPSGTIIPWYAFQSTLIGQLTTSLTYTGTGIVGTPPNTSEAALFNVTFMGAVCSLYKTFEPYMAPVSNMNIAGDVGDSLLDTTILVGHTTSGACGLVSRRPIDDAFEYTAMSNSPFVTYAICEDTLSNGTTGISNQLISSNSYGQEYNQGHRRDLSGLTTQASLYTMFKAEGLVVGALTSNMSNASGTSNVDPRGGSAYPPPGGANPVLLAPDYPSTFSWSDLTREAPNESASLARRFASRLIPRDGNYCGPGWTAGKDTFTEETLVGPDGTYTVKPTNEEDAVCKAHDEAYRRSKTAADIYAADAKMVKELGALQKTKGLSLYSHGAKMAISAKMVGADLIDGVSRVNIHDY